METKVMHIADLHLRTSQFGRPERGPEFTQAVLEAVKIANEHGVKTILAAGDIFDKKTPASETVADLYRIDEALKGFGIRMLLIQGDHDASNPSWVNSLQGIHNIQDIGGMKVRLDEDPLVTVYGVDKAKMHPDAFRKAKDSWPEATVLMYHGPVQEFCAFKVESSDGAFSLGLRDLPVDKYQVIALGDIHVSKYVMHEGCLVGYPGPTEYVGANEQPEKSVTILRFVDGKFQGLDKNRDIVRLPTRKVIHREVHDEDDLERLIVDLRDPSNARAIVQVWYASGMTGVFKRISSVVDPQKAHIRLIVLPKGETVESLRRMDVSDMSRRELSEFVPEFAEEGSPSYDAMVSLCDREANHAEILDAYAETRIRQLEEASLAS